jgi:hypothetical protein
MMKAGEKAMTAMPPPARVKAAARKKAPASKTKAKAKGRKNTRKRR